MDYKQDKNDLRRRRKTLATRLHDIRISKQLRFNQVCEETGIPQGLLDNLELGRGSVNLGALHLLAKYYGKKVEILLVDK